MPIVSDIQQPYPGKLVDLCEIDLARLGGGVFRFTPTPQGGGSLFFGGVEYVPWPVVFEKFEWSAQGTLPSPVIRVAAGDRYIHGLIHQYNNLVGAKFTRIRTFAHYLDNGSSPDDSQVLSRESYRIERKVVQGKGSLHFELSAWADQDGRELPNRQVLTFCTRPYRKFAPSNPAADSDGFLYADTPLACPYHKTIAAVEDWAFENTAAGWSATGFTTTLTADSIELEATQADPTFTSPTIAVDGSFNTLVKVTMQRLAGTSWTGLLEYDVGGGFVNQVAFAEVDSTEGTRTIYIDLSQEGAWTGGTIQALRLTLVADSGDKVALAAISVGASQMYDLQGNVTNDPAVDVCSKYIEKGGCKLRFGAYNPLPTSAFPLISRTKG